MYSATTRSPSILIAALVLTWASSARAQSSSAGDPRFAADHFEPATRGSEWFASDSLNLEAPVPVRAGVVSSYGERLFVVRDANGNTVRSPLRNDEVLHAGASAYLFDLFRVGFDLPLQLITAGKTFGDLRGPKHEQGVGDLRVDLDARVYGRDHDHLRIALGGQLFAPIGQQDQWLSDDSWRVRPRVLVAGDYGLFVWSAQVGILFRDSRIGSELGVSGAAGLRVAKQLTVGPEFWTSTTLDDNAFRRALTPFEAMIGAHWLIAHTVRIGGGIGRGFTQSAVDPDFRILGSVEYAPEPGEVAPKPVVPKPLPPPPPPVGDRDHDGVSDDQDACPGVAGIPTMDPPTNGCPPDTDGDGINDLGDACPTQPGPASADASTNGCPKP